jgi:hypothetical protein
MEETDAEKSQKELDEEIKRKKERQVLFSSGFFPIVYICWDKKTIKTPVSRRFTKKILVLEHSFDTKNCFCRFLCR